MGARLLVVLISVALTSAVFAKEVYLSIGGSVGNFRTDARIFNPSFTKDITITARYLPAGNSNNSGVASKTITVAKRSMVVYDDVVQSLFGGGAALGAIRLTSDDDFVASQRIYADESNTPKNGTLGQFVPGLDVTTAKKKGVLIQLKASGGRGVKGTFRTNWGGVNPNPTVANISFKLYGKNNTVAGTNNLTLQPFGVFSPNNIVDFFGVTNADVSDAWLSFESDQPIFVYGSVLDNGSEDPTFIPAVDDTGVAPPVEPQAKTVNVQAVDWDFSLTPSAPLAAGDQVKFIVKGVAGNNHGFRLFTPDGNILIDIDSFGANAIERTVTLPKSGEYVYICTRTACGAGHTEMNGSFTVP